MLALTPSRTAGEPFGVLFVGAHPDDIEIGCFGTLARLLEDPGELHVTWMVLSGSGERRAEAIASASALLEGAARCRIEVEGFRDSYFPFEGAAIKDRLHELGREIDPHLVFTHRTQDRHQDHRLVAELTWNVFRDHSILEYEVPKYDGDPASPNLFTPMDEAVCRAKWEHLHRYFPSQREKAWFTESTVSGLARLRGVECRSPGGFAEGFELRKALFAP